MSERPGDDERDRLLGLLPTERLREVARMRMDGYTNAEIAAKFGASVLAVERWCYEIRRFWEERGEL